MQIQPAPAMPAAASLPSHPDRASEISAEARRAVQKHVNAAIHRLMS